MNSTTAEIIAVRVVLMVAVAALFPRLKGKINAISEWKRGLWYVGLLLLFLLPCMASDIFKNDFFTEGLAVIVVYVGVSLSFLWK